MADIRGLQAMGRQYSKSIGALGERVEELLEPGESARVIAQARPSGRFSEFRDKGGLLLVLTARRMVAIESGSGKIADSFPLNSELNIKWEPPKGHPARLTATRAGVSRVYYHVLPVREAGRIFMMATNSFNQDARRLPPAGFPPESAEPLVGTFIPGTPPRSQMLYLYRDRVVVATWPGEGGEHYPFGGDVAATVDTAGNLAVTRGRNLAAKGLGLGIAGGAGVFLMGNAKERVTDTRELYLLLEGETWAASFPCRVNAGADARRFAQLVNASARQYAASKTAASSTPSAPTPASDPAARLEQLKNLLERGLISDGEFAAERQRILHEI